MYIYIYIIKNKLTFTFTSMHAKKLQIKSICRTECTLGSSISTEYEYCSILTFLACKALGRTLAAIWLAINDAFGANVSRKMAI